MPCFLCPHPTCKHSLIAQGVCACPECSGTLVLDPLSAPKWRLYCNMCNCLVYLPEGAHRISTTQDRCPECESTILEVDFNKKTTPLPDGSTLYSGCILCDELLHSLVRMKHGKSFFKRMGSRGRGRGSWRGGFRGRGRSGRLVDPKMSFRDFWELHCLKHHTFFIFDPPKLHRFVFYMQLNEIFDASLLPVVFVEWLGPEVRRVCCLLSYRAHSYYLMFYCCMLCGDSVNLTHLYVKWNKIFNDI